LSIFVSENDWQLFYKGVTVINCQHDSSLVPLITIFVLPPYVKLLVVFEFSTV